MLSELLTNNIKKKAVMILGLSGTGKSTLVNYLIGFPLICKRIDGQWKIELANINNEGAKIGHTSRSKTFYPSVYSTINSDFSFIDTPGIKDNRGISVEIANAFFRQEVLKDVDELKFVLLITYHDIYVRGDQFRASIKALAEFLGIFDESNVHSKISSSIGIVVTMVENDGETDEEMIKRIKKKLNEILDGAKEANEFKFEEKVYRNILIKSNIQIFSNPKFLGLLKDFQQKNILNMIENLDYIAKRHVKIRMSVEAKYFEQLFAYIESIYKIFEVFFRERIKSALIQYYDKNERDLIYINKTIEVYKKFLKLKQSGNKSLKLKEFLCQCSEFFNQSDVDAILTKQTLIEFYSFLLKNETREKSFSFQRVWLDTHLMENIEKTLDRILNHFDNQFKDFNNMIQNKTIEALSVFYKTKKAITRDASDAANLYQALDELNKNGTKLNSIESYLAKLAEEHVFKKEEVQAILNTKNALQNLIDLLPNEIYKANYAFKKEWVTTQISSNISMYLDDITSFVQTKFEDFKVFIEKSLEIELKKYFKNAVNASISKEDIRLIEKTLNQFKSIALKELSIQDVITNISESIMSKSIKDQVNSTRAEFNEFIKILSNEKAKYFKKKTNWIGSKIVVLAQNLLDELKLFYSESVKDYSNGTVTVNGHFGNLSNVLNYIKSSDLINDLKTVRVYTTHSFLLDEDYLVPSGKYKEHSPDLIIISPYVSIAKKITVDLSCQITPDFPDRKSKANDGWAAGEAGDDGKPGLPGCNGGDLLIIADTISNPLPFFGFLKVFSVIREEFEEFEVSYKVSSEVSSEVDSVLIDYLNFTSNGGKGGPGQSGNFHFLSNMLKMRYNL
jgi:GTPase SAR1 family protein